MPEPLSQDMRKRIIRAKECGDSHVKIARELQVSVSAITRLLALYELKEEFALPVSLPALCKTINRKLGLRRKKRHTRQNST